ncbi:hypothetical protein ACGF7U_31265 [Micromonospora sp. NPDC047670]|uniref:hypothetical protein n=1 Tax=Micromonospora sp. NPDC047670 TaxID=3364252 RepID=UPI00371C5B49
MTTKLQLPTEPMHVGPPSVPPTTDTQVGLADESRTWWFTFRPDCDLASRYVAVYGEHDPTRLFVEYHFRDLIAGQFASAEEAGVQRLGLVRLRRDEWPAAGGCPLHVEPQPDDCAACREAAPAAVVDAAAPYALTPLGVRALESVPAEVPQEHRHVAGSGGAPGECSAVCACGVTFDGFDTIAEAVAMLDGHIADPDGTAIEERGIPAEQLRQGMFVATGDTEFPGWEVRHVEPSDDGGKTFVGVLFAGPLYREYDVGELIELVDKDVVDEAAARARARAHRAQQIDALRQLADLAEQDEHFPLPRYVLHVSGGVDSPEAVRRFAAATDTTVTEDGYGTRAVWRYGGTEHTPAVEVEVSAPHPRPGPAVGRQSVTPAAAGADAGPDGAR